MGGEVVTIEKFKRNFAKMIGAEIIEEDEEEDE